MDELREAQEALKIARQQLLYATAMGVFTAQVIRAGHIDPTAAFDAAERFIAEADRRATRPEGGGG